MSGDEAFNVVAEGQRQEGTERGRGDACRLKSLGCANPPQPRPRPPPAPGWRCAVPCTAALGITFNL